MHLSLTYAETPAQEAAIRHANYALTLKDRGHASSVHVAAQALDMMYHSNAHPMVILALGFAFYTPSPKG